MQFSDTTNRTGIVEALEDFTNTQSSTTASYPLKTKTRDINNAFAHFMMLAIRSSGRWQVDDTNQTDYPIITFDIVSGQDNYAFTTDGSTPANQILDLHQFRIKNTSGNWINIRPIDRAVDDINAYQGLTGTPEAYDLTSNGIILFPTPNYNSDEGAEMYVSRTPSYFLSTDTTKKPGIPDMFHEYLVIRPAYFYSLAKGLPRARDYKAEMDILEREIQAYYGRRPRYEKVKMSVVQQNNR